MNACVDVDYRDAGAVAACVVFADWPAAQPARTYTIHLRQVEPYEPGQFYKRELPCLLEVLSRVTEPLEVVVIDGHVWLTAETDPGLGAHLYEALHRRSAVIGVAKSRFHGTGPAREVFRGRSHRPL
jgi:deoxyribonuclease V